MPCDDPFLKELGGYLKAAEPGQRERADAWATAIGLQKVDGLEAFFRNLLLGEDNLLKSRLMLIGMNERERKAMMVSLGIAGRKGGQKSSLKSSLKSKARILAILSTRPGASLPFVAEKTGMSLAGVKKNIRQLKEEGRLRRVGPDKGGHWEVAK